MSYQLQTAEPRAILIAIHYCGFLKQKKKEKKKKTLKPFKELGIYDKSVLITIKKLFSLPSMA
jgi:hypothetical protein